MISKYYTLPIEINTLLQKKQHPLCALAQSIAQNIYLVITSHFGESYYDENYGCLIWEKDFEMASGMRWIENIQPSLQQSIVKSEKRLVNVVVKVDVDEFEFKTKEKSRAKKRITINVKGVIGKTNESFHFNEKIYISPLSFN
jgi:hypothetical protein